MSRARDFADIATVVSVSGGNLNVTTPIVSSTSGTNRSHFLVRVTTNTELDIDGAGNTVVDYNTFGAVVQNQGSDYTIANNRYTCPVTGIYHFQARSRLDNIGSGYALNAIGPAGLATNYNGTGTAEIDALWASSYFLSGGPASNYETVTCSTTMKLTAGQTVQHYIVIQSDGSVTINNRGSAFSGTLIGSS
tara:strand:+ start:1270 stop:1845 length:576 start_codon:yes stop_codon:yes gene_type:complete